MRICTQEASLFLPAIYTTLKTSHIYWLHGFAGCGKSSISLEVAKIFAQSGRLLASYFFFRGAGDRGTMERFAVTLASQLVAAIPATAPLIEAAVREAPGLVTGDVSLATQLDLLVLSPFQAVIEGIREENPAKGPFLIVIDGLDECEDKLGVKEFIDHMLAFFKKYPAVPLRVFIASRVEQHIRTRLEVDEVRLGNLNSHWPGKDIEKFLQESFRAVVKRDRVIQAYVQTHGEWPTSRDMSMLIEHVQESFVLASTNFKYIIQTATEEDPKTPMERLPLALQMNGLDTVYAQTLTHSQHIPHFHNIISTIALLVKPLPISGIADLLGIETFEVVHVLLNLQAIIHVPDACDFTDGIEQLKAGQPPRTDRFPYHAFLCSGLFYSLFWAAEIWDDDPLTECAKQLALALECPDHRTELWLKQEFIYGLPDYNEGTLELTEHTPQTVQHYMQRASTAIHAKFPEILQHRVQSPSIGAQEEYVIQNSDSMSGMHIFNWLEWVTARTQFKREERKIASRLPLTLYFYASEGSVFGKLIFTF
ncbi:hypothetical protein EST38_g8734 [Candolleomyces aberdarensis]|uniref:Nephrocystin 3-like N-terminal domain-containing protein n=1 Tax=Candolleomyces aberdarensis TaxID=2316362 RepID=A0A4Q2DEM8_9AGAR|nr:hypothetical protein EST38_g8734 [Candolleomyces aberdarensis]